MDGTMEGLNIEPLRITPEILSLIHLKALVEQGHLARHGAGRGAWYGLA